MKQPRKYPLWDVAPARLYPPGRLCRKLPDFLFRWNPIRILWMPPIDIFEIDTFKLRCNKRHRLTMRRLKKGLYP